jgi:hypothetical protein
MVRLGMVGDEIIDALYLFQLGQEVLAHPRVDAIEEGRLPPALY